MGGLRGRVRRVGRRTVRFCEGEGKRGLDSRLRKLGALDPSSFDKLRMGSG